MKLLSGEPFDRWRDRSRRTVEWAGGPGDDQNGCFIVPQPGGDTLRVIASNGFGWDHVSVTVLGKKRCPRWEEMSFIKRAFFRPDEWAIELHPPAHLNVNNHPYCLHLWRAQDQAQPLPAPIMVGV